MCFLLFQVTLAGYYFAFRYCPEGKHVARREGSRTPHEGTVEFISHDSHKGAGESVSDTSPAGAVSGVGLYGVRASCLHLLLLLSRHLCAPGTHFLFSPFPLASFQAAVLGIVRLLSNCSKRCRGVPAPSGVLAPASVQGIENWVASCWLR